jgi:plastocyanin
VTRRAAVLLLVAVGIVLGGCAGTDPGGTASASGSPSDAASSSAPDTGTPATEETGRRVEVSVGEGQVSGDTGRVPVALGETVTLVVTSDVADEVHVHGYDLAAAVAADRPTSLTFTADTPGVFEVELHDAGTALLSLQVG